MSNNDNPIIDIPDDDPTIMDIPTSLDWDGIWEDMSPGPGDTTYLYTTVEMMGIPFYVDAFAVDESGEALCSRGARMLKRVREIDDYEVGARYRTVQLIPGLNFMVVFTPFREPLTTESKL
jgi:hypothetical protein